MNGFRLETFAPHGAAGTAAAQPPITPAALAAAEQAAYEAGYLDGHGSASEAHLADQARLTSDLVEALSDARLTNDAARRHVMASIAPLIRALAGAIAPALAAAGLAGEVAARVEAALGAVPGATPRLICAPEQRAALEAALAARMLSARIEADPRLLACEVELHWDEGFDRIDLEACAAEVIGCIASHLDPEPTLPTETGPSEIGIERDGHE